MAARPCAPPRKTTLTSMVGVPRESRISSCSYLFYRGSCRNSIKHVPLPFLSGDDDSAESRIGQRRQVSSQRDALPKGYRTRLPISSQKDLLLLQNAYNARFHRLLVPRPYLTSPPGFAVWERQNGFHIMELFLPEKPQKRRTLV